MLTQKCPFQELDQNLDELYIVTPLLEDVDDVTVFLCQVEEAENYLLVFDLSSLTKSVADGEIPIFFRAMGVTFDAAREIAKGIDKSFTALLILTDNMQKESLHFIK